jgi:hypothetical protein
VTEISEWEWVPVGPAPEEIVWTGVPEVNAYLTACYELRHAKWASDEARATWQAIRETTRYSGHPSGAPTRLRRAAGEMDRFWNIACGAFRTAHEARAAAHEAAPELAAQIDEAFPDHP